MHFQRSRLANNPTLNAADDTIEDQSSISFIKKIAGTTSSGGKMDDSSNTIMQIQHDSDALSGIDRKQDQKKMFKTSLGELDIETEEVDDKMFHLL